MTVTTEPLVDTLTEDPRWEAFGLADLAEPAARATLARLGLPAEGFAISLLGCSDARIAVLNADFRGRPQPTNVLSWPSQDRAAAADGGDPAPPRPGPAAEPAELGDIAIAWETCMREAGDAWRPMPDHVTHLIVHGVLHLLGYDHIRDKDAALMESLEVETLASLGVADPYE